MCGRRAARTHDRQTEANRGKPRQTEANRGVELSVEQVTSILKGALAPYPASPFTRHILTIY